MLTEEIGKLRAQLIKKGYRNRTEEEDKLLRELDALDSSPILNESFEKAQRSENFKSYGGSGQVCSECQRPF